MNTTSTEVATVVPMSGSKTGVARTAVLATSAAAATNLIGFELARVAGVEFAQTGSTTTIGAGAVLGPIMFIAAPGFDLLLTGLTGGTIAYLAGKKRA